MDGKWTETTESHRHFNWHRHCLVENGKWIMRVICCTRFVSFRWKKLFRLVSYTAEYKDKQSLHETKANQMCIHICRNRAKSNIDFNGRKNGYIHHHITNNNNNNNLWPMHEHNVAIDWCGHFDGFKQWLEFPLQAMHCNAPLHFTTLSQCILLVHSMHMHITIYKQPHWIDNIKSIKTTIKTAVCRPLFQASLLLVAVFSMHIHVLMRWLRSPFPVCWFIAQLRLLLSICTYLCLSLRLAFVFLCTVCRWNYYYGAHSDALDRSANRSSRWTF